ncbi:MAG: hypothetical protein LBL90_04910 [Prevotellaceae bacterium]|jgi:nicotinamidase-related amidase|nr:hypothetical protein [Prevotellaceae bacterium]
MKNNNLLLIIDPQNDFCLPHGALYVPGAENDMARLAGFIKNNYAVIDQIIISLDTHHVLDISHPYYWRDSSGGIPAPYTQITYKELVGAKWTACFDREKAALYLRQLEEQKEFPHVIWPEHCIAGSAGAAIIDVLMNELKNWERLSNTHFQIIEKGLNPASEMFGIFRANIPDPEDASTAENKALINHISQFDKIIVVGEAKSHCVANSIKQLFDYPEVMKKLVILDDCMSNVRGFETIAAPIYEKALQIGAKILKSSDLSI